MKKIFILGFLLCSHIAAAQNSHILPATPPMGWNSWDWFGKKEISEDVVREVIDSMVSSGLKDAGYSFVIVDGGWRDKKLGPKGRLLPNPKRFSQGIKPLADYAHSKGLKFGVHTVPGTHDCGGDKVGGFGHEKIQIQQFVDWGLDFIKLDKCKYTPGWSEDLVKKTYLKWKRLIDQSDRDIVLSISVYRFRTWFPGNCQMARTTGDIKARVSGGAKFDGGKHSVMSIAEVNNESAPYAGHGYWNDPDMLAMGQQGLTIEQQKVHFALWCIMSAPLMLGNDPRHMTQKEKAIIMNRDAIVIDQDPTEQGMRISVRNDAEIWVKHLEDGRMAVLFINRNEQNAKDITLPFVQLGITGEAHLKDVYAQKQIGKFKNSFTRKIQPQSGLFLLVERRSH